jgi:hypothetical protein
VGTELFGEVVAVRQIPGKAVIQARVPSLYLDALVSQVPGIEGLQMVPDGYWTMPFDSQITRDKITEIRVRKGLRPDLPDINDFLDRL